MISSKSGNADRRYDEMRMPAPDIPTRKTPWFMKALWALAALLLVGMGYSFWRISEVPSPRLDLPQTQAPNGANAR